MNKQKTCMIFAVAIIAFILLVGRVHSTSLDDLLNPVKTAAQDKISSLPGLDYTPSFKQYSGYLAADTTNNRFLHYWLVESQSRPSDDPLVLWLNGGPGCSSLLGMFTELGPFLFDEKQEQLVKNEFAWNQHANILFLESPAGVGYSYAVHGDLTTNDDLTAERNYQALISFFDKFPQFTNRSLYLTGQSYAGVYIPMLATLVDKNKTMNLKGISLGNGRFDVNKQTQAKLFFSRYHNLVGSTLWNNYITLCCHNKLDQRSLCDKGGPLNGSTYCETIIHDLIEEVEMMDIDFYNIYAKCDSFKLIDCVIPRRKRSNFVKGKEEILDTNSRLNEVDQMKQRASSLHFDHSGNNLPCDYEYEKLPNYLNSLQIMKALHIPISLDDFKLCWNEGFSYKKQYAQLPGGLTKVFQSLMQSDRKLKIVIYNGDLDWVCDFIGAEWFVDNLNDTLVADHSPWFVGKRLAGFVKQFEHITLMTVQGSGHSVPKDKPAEAVHLFEKYLLDLPPSSRSKIAQ